MSKSNHAPTQTCRTCNGTGKETLSGNPLKTYNALKSIQPATCYQVYTRISRRKQNGPLKKKTVLFRVHQTVARFEKNGLVRKIRKVVVNNVRRPAWEYEVV